MEHTHYDNLFVKQNAPIEVIRAAYRALAQKYHPDKNSAKDAERIMKIVNEAWEVLGDHRRRNEYDTQLNNPPLKSSRPSPNASKANSRKTYPSHEAPFHEDIDQSDIIIKIRPLVEMLWFKNFTEEYIYSYLKSNGLTSPNAARLIDEIFSTK